MIIIIFKGYIRVILVYTLVIMILIFFHSAFYLSSGAQKLTLKISRILISNIVVVNFTNS